MLFVSAYAIFVSSVMIDTMAAIITFPAMDPLLACIFGGVLCGASLGLMMLKNATTGGTELAARLLKYVFRSISVGKLCLAIDVTVVCIYALTYGKLEAALYGMIAMYIASVAMDTVVYGADSAKIAYIISDRYEAITQKLMEMGLGATILEGRGAFSNSSKPVLMCAAKPSKIAKIKAAVVEVDPQNAFIIVANVKEVYGEGFGVYSEDSL